MLAAILGANLDGARHGRKIFAMVSNTAQVANLAIPVRPVIEGTSTLSHFNHRPVIVTRDARDHVVQRFGPNLPAEICRRSLTPGLHLHWKQPILWTRHTLDPSNRRRNNP